MKIFLLSPPSKRGNGLEKFEGRSEDLGVFIGFYFHYFHYFFPIVFYNLLVGKGVFVGPTTEPGQLSWTGPSGMGSSFFSVVVALWVGS